ncbi:MAG: phage major capsid protein [Lachnospiraceae bacterium]|nr:phage major capsid protein [Lachnospiraceae bacterium]
MTFEQYQNRRNELLAHLREINEAENFDQAAFDETKGQIEALDAEWQARCQARADVEALDGNQPSVNNMVDLGRDAGAQMPVEPEDIHDSMEYRMAFMNYVVRGTAIPERFLNGDETTTTTYTGAVIPTTQMHELIRELKSRGNIWNKVRKLNVQGGVEFPIIDLVPVASWITSEPGDTDEQQVKAQNSVTFSYFGLECKIAQSLLSSVVSLKEFEDLFPVLAAEAMIAKLEAGVFNGTGSGQMKGILNETRIPVGNTITMSPADFASWTMWKKKVFAKMKKAYRKGDFIMAQSTFDGYIDGMVDTTGQPIGRVNYGIDGGENYRFGGKTVETVEEDIIKPYDSADVGDVVAVFGDLSCYGVNTNLSMRVVKWTDNDTNKEKTKATMIVDGKVLDPYGFLIIKKGAGDDSES